MEITSEAPPEPSVRKVGSASQIQTSLADKTSRELVKALAAAQGLQISDERLELVRREYENFMQLADEIAKLPVPSETEPRSSISDR